MWRYETCIDELMRDNTKENLSFQDVNIEDDMAGVERLRIRSIPTIIVFKGDEELWRKTGVIAHRIEKNGFIL